MNEKKSIDRLFQERFKDFDAAPDPALWDKIKKKQGQHQKRVLVFPLWYRIAGVAALVVLLLFAMGNYWSSDHNNSTIEIVKENNSVTKEQISPINSDSKEAITSTEKVSEKKININPISPSEKKPIISDSKINNPTTEIAQQSSSKNPSSQKTVPNQNRNKNIIANLGNSGKTIQKDPKEANTIAYIKRQQANIISEKQDSQLQNYPDYQNSTDGITAIQSNENTTDSGVNTNPEAELINKVETPATTENKGNSIYDAIAEVTPHEKEKKTERKWLIMPTVAPVFYNSVGEGSSIGVEYADNNQTAEANLSYGLQIAYEASNRISIRTGINKVNLSYTTDDVGLSSAIISGKNNLNETLETSSALQLVDLSTNQEGTALNSPQQDALDVFTASEIVNNNNVINTRIEGIARQNLGYFEIPLEVKYALINKRVGIHVIGGISTLFLNASENRLSFDTNDGNTTTIGSAENLNSFSWSSNLGVGMDYKLSKRFKINLEPIFKYQLNAYDNTTDFKPYIFGVYTGLSYRF